MMVIKDFLQGMSDILSICPPEREIKINLPPESDEEAIRKDWEAVGNDMRFGMEKCTSGKE